MENKDDQKNTKPQGEQKEFIKETIKDKPINKKRYATKMVLNILLAVVFGIVAAVVFTLVIRHNGSTGQRLRTHVDLSDEVSDDTAAVSNEETDGVSLDELAAVSADEAEHEDAASVSENETGSENKAHTQIINNNIVKKVSINISDYKKLYEELYDAAKRAEKCIVTVTGVSSDVDWFDNSFENENKASGFILAENGRELLILVDGKNIEGKSDIKVRFSDDSVYEGVAGNVDPNTGLMIVGVELESISDDTMREIKRASLGNSNSDFILGEPVIAIGSPIGSNSLAYGFVTSASEPISMVDREVKLIKTDIYGSTDASGVIVDYNGTVLGVICNGVGTTTGADNLINAYSISDLRSTLEKLSNGSALSRMGIYGTDVTEEAEDAGVPFGAYVKRTVMDGPAMNAGIQNGDVITKIGTKEITCFSDYQKAIEAAQPNDEIVVTVMRFARGEYQEMSFDVTLDILEKVD
ncbi:MAG: S1C family serine protease [Lachnospiraceae bacterium]|nr:S1C family serine protease [Lachnospiraceae bacterium]